MKLDDVWNWEKNNENGINPYKIAKCSGKKVWLYCQEKDYHNDYGGYKMKCSNFYNNQRCPYCHRKKIHYKDSLAYNYPNIAKMIAIKENNLTFEDCYKISCTSGSYYCKCLDCGNITDKKIRLGNIIFQGFSCSICSDGISIPNKFMANIFKQLNIDFMTELNKSDFEWCGYFKYDFYLPKYNIIIEINGEQHYKECDKFKRNLFEEQMNDLFKYKCAKSHVDNYIVIDCRYSELEWMKENITKELNGYFDLSNIDWELAWEKSQNSKVIECCKLWSNNLNTLDISHKMNLNQTTVIKYLKIGSELNLCNYSVKLSRDKANKKNSGKNNKNSKKVICITTKRIFDNASLGAKYYNINRRCITNCCNKSQKYAGKLKNGTKLVWRYIKWNHDRKYYRKY